ncbi:MAG TPA: Pls/PosA family non-ribosomal peptide synthetase [Ktedonobacteraceae bacterium]|nr:Pls/PosA family non-ribosomal peptide synthetase [Ktedonobacteraceae bacterium]
MMSIDEKESEASLAQEKTVKLRRTAPIRAQIPAAIPHPPKKMELERLSLGETTTLVMRAIKKIHTDFLHDYFEMSCDKQPNATAIICGSSRLTYSELDRRANRLAHLLIARGIVEGDPIGIFLERSVDTYVALLGVLKAGAAFVPLDPSFPTDRVAFIAEDAGLQAFLTTSTLREKTSALPCLILELDQITEELADQSDARPQVHIDSASLCYIIYTSGTTGRPKGVAVSHANITNFLRVVTPIYRVTRADRVYQGMTIAFDFSMEEIWPTWIAGATLVAGPTDSRRLGHGLAEFLIEQKITILYCVPTLLATIDTEIPSLRALMVGGEACPSDLVQRWSRPGRRMLNTYGPTETTVTATWCELVPGRPVTIGVPLPTYQIYILDDKLRLVEDGESGEICIGGPGVAIGYLNRPDLTESRFVPNPIWHAREIAPRLYRTGDLGRITRSKEIEYLGRIDTQVKIRGYRIELGEIEQVLREDQTVENAVVKPLEVNGVAQDLIGYLTLRSRMEATNIEQLRERLHAALRLRLPSYMVPSFIEVLAEFPLLAADKVNRAALPAPVLPRLGATTLYIPPATRLESTLAVTWGQILGRERVSVEDDFFTDLGGHSLVAAQLISKLRQESRLQGLSIGDLYANPTIRNLAQFIEHEVARPTTSTLPTIQRPELRKHSTPRVLSSGLVQLVAIYVLVFITVLPVLGLRWAMDDTWRLVWLGVAEVVWLSLAGFLLPIVAGRLLMTGVRPGLYPLWGVTYLRWWLYRRILALSPIGLLAGTPLLPLHLRLLGAKIGSHCHLASIRIGLPMFVEIGEGVSIGYGAQLQPFEVQDGWLRLAPIHIGRGTFLGTNSVVLAGAWIGNNAFIAEQTLVPQDHVISTNESWSGSPGRRQEAIPSLLKFMTAKADGRRWPIPVLLGFVTGTIVLTVLAALMLVPSTVLVLLVAMRAGLYWGMASTLLAGPLFVFTTCTLVLIGKRIVMPHVEPGIYSLRSGFGVRKWMSDQLMAMSLGFTNTLYATLYLVPFLRMLGARIGRWAEVSTMGNLDPDMLRIGNESFVADIAVVAPAVFHHGSVALAPATIGDRSFVGNGALIPIATQIGDNSLIGVYSLPPAQQVDPGTSWLGSPAIFLPHRQESKSFDDALTYRPRRSLLAWRLFIEFFRVTLPATILAFTILLAFEAMFYFAPIISPLALLGLTPLLTLGIGVAATLLVIVLKWTIVGRYRPRVEPLWSVFVRRSELITALYEAVAVPSLVGLLTGTPWIAPLLRLFGAHIGRRVWMDTTYLTEFDLVEVGDDAAIGDTTSLQTHLFEDRVMKMSTVKIGAASSVGSRSVVLYDAEVGPGATLDSLSLAMKGETLPAGSRWRGIPARSI